MTSPANSHALAATDPLGPLHPRNLVSADTIPGGGTRYTFRPYSGCESRPEMPAGLWRAEGGLTWAER